MNAALLDEVWRRAQDRCEYCQMPHSAQLTPFQIDHVIARKHRGETAADNLALSCLSCNTH